MVGIAFPNPSGPREAQLMWRLAAWIASIILFGVQLFYEHFRFHNPSRKTALHVAIATAIGAFGLAIAANIHVLNTGGDNSNLLIASLILWPVIIGVPAFVVAIIIAAVLARIKN